jgi:signal transduction histidine kinase
MEFIIENNLKRVDSLLIQCFDGVLDIKFTQSILELLKSVLPRAIIIGVSTDGEIADSNTMNQKFVMSFSIFESTKLYSKVISLKNQSEDVGKMLGEYGAKVDAKALILFSDPFHSNGDALMRGIRQVNSELFVGGGMAGDNGLFKRTYVIHGFEIYLESCVALFLSGESLHVKSMSSFNWIPIGPTFTVTKAHDNCVYMVDDISIVQAYREYFGENVANKLPSVGVAFPIIVNIEGEDVGRAPMMLLEEEGLAFGGMVPQGSKIRFAIGNTQLLIEASNAMQLELLQEPPESIFIYSCMVRRRFLGSAVDMEIKPLAFVAPLCGFFTYGEFYTDSSKGACSLLNETMTLMTLSENKSLTKTKREVQASDVNHDWSIITFDALSHLINKTSIELQSLNRSLQERVEEEISKNRDKVRMMLTQSKQATMGEMMSMIAHQWRQPIATIGLIADNLALDVAMDEISPEKILEAAELIVKQVHYLSKTIDDFSSYFRPENAKKSFTIGSFFQELSQILGKSLEHKRIQLHNNFDAQERIYTFKQELAQMCINIINNAEDALIEHAVEDGYIEFSYQKTGNQHQIKIKDNAGGIAPEIADKVFEPYYSTKDEKHGTGLGLYTSKTIAQQTLGGDLIHYNEGSGFVFLISFDIEDDIKQGEF